MKKLGRQALLFGSALMILSFPTIAISDQKEDCIVGGRVFEEAILAQAISIAFGEVIDWHRVDYYTLSKSMQNRLEADVAAMMPRSQSVVADLQSQAIGWNREGMDGHSMMRKILLKGLKGVGEGYSVKCLKTQQENENKPAQPNGGEKGDSSHKKTRS